jgi:predicted Zn finger-like uncharacterized protein
MDVTCERCKAEYEFDDSLLGEKGTTVKCSSCQHVFRVAPPRKDARPMMKLRFRANGIIAPIASLRELQQRIQAGQIGPDDELGRDGSPWRKLQDVPELRGFFAAIADEQPTAARARPAGLSVSQDSLPSPRTSAQPAKRTMVGVGPSQTPNIPPSPRVPAQVSSGYESRGPSPSAPGGAPMVDARPVPTDAMATTHTASNPAKTLPPMAAVAPTAVVAAAAGAQSAAASAFPAPNARSAGGPPIAAPKPESKPVSPSLPPVSSKTSLAPSAGTPADKPSIPGPSAAPRLYLADDEAPPARATEGNKSWLYIGAAGLLAIGGWLGVSAISSNPEAPATPPPRVEAPQAAPASPEATAEATPPGAPGATPGATAPTADPKSAAPNPSGESAASAEAKRGTGNEPANTPEKPAKTVADAPPAEEAPAEDAERSEETDRSPRGGSSSSANSEPTDYTGWVSRGAKLAKQGKHDEARTAFTKALELRASGSEANAGLGAVLVASDQAQAAIEPLEKAARAGYAEANVTLGDAYRKVGRKEDALEAYNTYVARFPSGSRAAYAKLQASALGGDKKEGPAVEEPAGSPVDYKPAGEPPTPAEPTQ